MAKKNRTKQEPIQQIGAWEHALPYLDGTYWIRSFAVIFLIGLIVQGAAETSDSLSLSVIGWALIFGGASIFGAKILLVTAGKIIRWFGRRIGGGVCGPRAEAAASICDRLNPTWAFVIFVFIGGIHGFNAL